MADRSEASPSTGLHVPEPHEQLFGDLTEAEHLALVFRIRKDREQVAPTHSAMGPQTLLDIDLDDDFSGPDAPDMTPAQGETWARHMAYAFANDKGPGWPDLSICPTVPPGWEVSMGAGYTPPASVPSPGSGVQTDKQRRREKERQTSTSRDVKQRKKSAEMKDEQVHKGDGQNQDCAEEECHHAGSA